MKVYNVLCLFAVLLLLVACEGDSYEMAPARYTPQFSCVISFRSEEGVDLLDSLLRLNGEIIDSEPLKLNVSDNRYCLMSCDRTSDHAQIDNLDCNIQKGNGINKDDSVMYLSIHWFENMNNRRTNEKDVYKLSLKSKPIFGNVEEHTITISIQTVFDKLYDTMTYYLTSCEQDGKEVFLKDIMRWPYADDMDEPDDWKERPHTLINAPFVFVVGR